MSRATALVLATATIIAGLLASCAILLPPAWAHDHGEGSWMNHMSLLDPVSHQWCCNEQDCAPVPAGGVVDLFPLAGSSNAPGTAGHAFLVVETDERIPDERVIWRSPDGRWWRCRNLAGDEAGKTRCLIGPPRGM